MEVQRLPRREREKLAQREEILAAALDLFSEKGYPNVSMQEISEKAEFAIGTLYKFFRSKEELYRALLREKATRFHDALAETIAAGSGEIEKLRNFVRVKGELFRAHAAMIRIYFSETQGARHNFLAGFDCEMREYREDILRKLAAVFRSGMDGGRFRKGRDPYHLAIALEGLTNAFLLLWLENPGLHAGLDDPDAVLDILLDGLTEPIEKPEDSDETV
ncbi:MAG: TetR/AcrR family transcriptional regulator [Thermodesulfobacteriota bacterium]